MRNKPATSHSVARECKRFLAETLARPAVQAMDPALRYEYVNALGLMHAHRMASQGFYKGKPTLERLR